MSVAEDACASSSASSTAGFREAFAQRPFAAGGHGLNLRATLPLPTRQLQHVEQPAGALCHEDLDEVPVRMSMREFLCRYAASGGGGEALRTPPASGVRRLVASPPHTVQEKPLDAGGIRHSSAEPMPRHWSAEPMPDRLLESPFNALPPLPPLAHILPSERPLEPDAPRGVQGRGDGLRQHPQPRARTSRIKVAAEPSFPLGTSSGKATDLGAAPPPLRLALQIRPRARNVFHGDLGGVPTRCPKLGWEEGQQVLGRESSDLSLEDTTPASGAQNARQRWRRQP